MWSAEAEQHHADVGEDRPEDRGPQARGEREEERGDAERREPAQHAFDQRHGDVVEALDRVAQRRDRRRCA